MAGSLAPCCRKTVTQRVLIIACMEPDTRSSDPGGVARYRHDKPLDKAVFELRLSITSDIKQKSLNVKMFALPKRTF
jgi:hypothetical protein